MLSGCIREVVAKEGEYESLQHLGDWAEEGYGSVGATLRGRLVGLENGNYIGCLPDGRNVRVGYREVEDVAQILGAEWAQVPEMEDVEAIWSKGL